jgi:hypothetical protein
VEVVVSEIVEIIPVVLYLLVGVISLNMAYKNLFSNKFLAFHENVAGISWANIERPLQLVIITLMRVSGLGFLVVGLLLTIFPIVNYSKPHIFITYAIPVISILYCSGLLVSNFYLYKYTKINTPWKGSLYAVLIIILAMVISSL